MKSLSANLQMTGAILRDLSLAGHARAVEVLDRQSGEAENALRRRHETLPGVRRRMDAFSEVLTNDDRTHPPALASIATNAWWARRQQARPLDVPREAADLERADANPVEIELVPRETVTRARRMGVMVVVPAFAEGQERNPPVVGRIVARRKPARRPICASPSSPARSRAGRASRAGRCPTARTGRRRTPAGRGRRSRSTSSASVDSHTCTGSRTRSGT